MLEVRTTDDPVPGPGEVRVRARACGLNFAELMARVGLYPDAPKPPCVVGYEAAGVVDAVGEGVREIAPGRRVVVFTRFGGHSDTVCVPESQAWPIPDEMSFEQAAAIPVVYLTAYHMLFRAAELRPGMRVLVHMAAGGVGLAALQLCRTVPNVVTLGTASPQKHAFLRDNGCDHPIDYRGEDYAEAVRRVTEGKGVDLVLDPLGGADWKKGYSLLRPAGTLVAFGFANMAGGETRSIARVLKNFFSVPRFSPLTMMDDNRGVVGVNMGHLWSEMDLLREEVAELMRLWGEGRISPHIDGIYPFERAAEAHRRLHERKNVGKVLLVPDAARGDAG